MIVVPVLRDKNLLSWPKNALGGRVPYLPLDIALTTHFPGDAHFAAYCLPSVERRLCVALLRDPGNAHHIPDGVPMTLALFDVDCPAAHAAGSHAADDWWVGEKSKIKKLRRAHKDGFCYRTRGGYRLVYVLGELTTLRSERDDAAWTLHYLIWVAYLCRRFDIVADRACADWTRLFRLPHATRDESGVPEDMDQVGDPSCIGPWACDSTREDALVAVALSRKADRKPAKPRPPSYVASGDGALFYAFQSRGWMGRALEAGKWAVQCPWENEHSKGARFDSSTVLYAPGYGERLGWFHCSHQHCQGRQLRDVLACFSDHELRASA